MDKKLPSVKKSVRNFILDEDAKVIDNSFSKVAITAGFLAVNFFINLEDGNAGFFKKHTNEFTHGNNINAPENYDTGIHAGNNPTVRGINEITGKSVETVHSNHYNHQDGKKQRGWVAVAGFAALFGPLAPIGAIVGSVLNDHTSVGSWGDDDFSDIDTGTPFMVPEDVLEMLEQEERN